MRTSAVAHPVGAARATSQGRARAWRRERRRPARGWALRIGRWTLPGQANGSPSILPPGWHGPEHTSRTHAKHNHLGGGLPPYSHTPRSVPPLRRQSHGPHRTRRASKHSTRLSQGYQSRFTPPSMHIRTAWEHTTGSHESRRYRPIILPQQLQSDPPGFASSWF